MCVERFPHTANKSKQINNEKHYFECRISLLADKLVRGDVLFNMKLIVVSS